MALGPRFGCFGRCFAVLGWLVATEAGCAGEPAGDLPEEASGPRIAAASPRPVPEEESVAVLAAGSDPAAELGSAAAGPEPAPGPPIEPCLAESPPDMACVPAGPFSRGTDDGPENTRPSATVWLSTYYIDRHEVTYAAYQACVERGACPRSGPRYTDFDHPRMPIQGVSWHDAVAFCEALGKQLPTEAQWEKAARGPDGNLYPWGDEPASCARAILKDETGRGCGRKKGKSKPEVGRPWDVGSRPPGAYGLHDMVGNAWEWVQDWYARSYEDCGAACEGVDPQGPCAGAATCPGHAFKIVRGGSWYWDASKATGVYRRPHVPSNRPFHHFGFRCAASPAQAAALVSRQ